MREVSKGEGGEGFYITQSGRRADLRVSRGKPKGAPRVSVTPSL